jgi:hypothetical protein
MPAAKEWANWLLFYPELLFEEGSHLHKSLFNICLSPHGRGLIKKLAVAQLGTKLRIFYEKWMSITAVTKEGHSILPWAMLIHLPIPYVTVLVLFTLLSFYLRPGLPSDKFTSDLLTEILMIRPKSFLNCVR